MPEPFEPGCTILLVWYKCVSVHLLRFVSVSVSVLSFDRNHRHNQEVRVSARIRGLRFVGASTTFDILRSNHWSAPTYGPIDDLCTQDVEKIWLLYENMKMIVFVKCPLIFCFHAESIREPSPAIKSMIWERETYCWTIESQRTFLGRLDSVISLIIRSHDRNIWWEIYIMIPPFSLLDVVVVSGTGTCCASREVQPHQSDFWRSVVASQMWSPNLDIPPTLVVSIFPILHSALISREIIEWISRISKSETRKFEK